jgi:hypothetical protein
MVMKLAGHQIEHEVALRKSWSRRGALFEASGGELWPKQVLQLLCASPG